MNKNITVIGNVASGKSTLVPVLARALEKKPVFADDLFQTRDPFRVKFFNDMSRWSLANELWLTKERVKLLTSYNSKDKGVIIDSGLLMSWVYAYSHFETGKMDLDEWQLYSELYDVLSQDLLKEMVVVRLSFPIETLMKRLKKRGRKYELEFYNPAYLGEIESGIEALEQKLEQGNQKVITLDNSQLGKLPFQTANFIDQIKAVL